MSGCVDHFATAENEAYECTRNIISTLNYELPEEDDTQVEEPLYSTDDLMGLAPRCYNHSMDVRLVRTLTPYMLMFQMVCGCSFTHFFLSTLFRLWVACPMVVAFRSSRPVTVPPSSLGLPELKGNGSWIFLMRYFKYWVSGMLNVFLQTKKCHHHYIPVLKHNIKCITCF